MFNKVKEGTGKWNSYRKHRHLKKYGSKYRTKKIHLKILKNSNWNFRNENIIKSNPNSVESFINRMDPVKDGMLGMTDKIDEFKHSDADENSKNRQTI